MFSYSSKDQKSDKGLSKLVSRSMFLPEVSRGEPVSLLFQALGGLPTFLGLWPPSLHLQAQQYHISVTLHPLSNLVPLFLTAAGDAFFILRIPVD